MTAFHWHKEKGAFGHKLALKSANGERLGTVEKGADRRILAGPAHGPSRWFVAGAWDEAMTYVENAAQPAPANAEGRAS